MTLPRGFRGRLLAVGVALAVAFGILAMRATYLSVAQGNFYRELAAKQQRRRVTAKGSRGAIRDRRGTLLASSLDVPSIYAHPGQIENAGATAVKVAAALGTDARRVRQRLTTKRPFVWIQRHAPPARAEAVEALDIDGIGNLNEQGRFYPRAELAAHLLGWVNLDGNGGGGLEQELDDTLRGEERKFEVTYDGRGRTVWTGEVPGNSLAGSRIELTIDARVQAIVEEALVDGVHRSEAAGGVAVVADPRTGEILALANVPTFDPNTPPGKRSARWFGRTRNSAVVAPFEPGSTLKAMLAASALDAGATAVDEVFFCEKGRFKYEGRWIHDTHKHGWLSFADVIKVSSNICTTKVATRIGAERYHRYLRSFGFGEPTGIGIPGESRGILRDVDAWAGIDLATHSFGQGIAVTAVQMVAAFGAIANGGTLMRPYVVRRVVGPDGTIVREHEPQPIRRVVSEVAARLTTELLRGVVEEEDGTGTAARLGDVPVAGKTGTAQKPRRDGRGYGRERVASFVGFLPADRPQLVVFVLIDEPQTSSYGGVVAAPVFRTIAMETLPLLDVPAMVPAPFVPDVVVADRRPARATRPAPVQPAAVDRVPSLAGLSLREALTWARAGAWQVDVAGWGYVASQRPRAGSRVPADRRLALTLRADTERR